MRELYWISYKEKERIEKLARQKEWEYFEIRKEEIIQHVINIYDGVRIGNKNKIIIGDEVYKIILKKRSFVFGVDGDALGYEVFQYKDACYKMVELR